MIKKKNTSVVRKIVKWTVTTVTVLVLILFILLHVKTYQPMDEAFLAMEQDNVTIENRVIVIEPKAEVLANLVFYQGGLVKTESYAVLGQLLAKEGFRVFIPKMLGNLAITNTNAFDPIFERYDDGKPWYIGGHSLGGASAGIFVANNRDNIAGLFFLGAYPSDASDLTTLQVPVISITASNDEILNIEKFNSTQTLLPDATIFAVIEGGNHSNFGYYGFQKGDGESQIMREVQHEQVVKLLRDVFLSTVK